MTPPLTRRRLIAAVLFAPPALAACSFAGGAPASPGPDPLIALADAARADAAQAAAAVAADPGLAARLDPLRAARTDHAAALDAEVARLAPTRTAVPTTAAAPATTAPADTTPTLAQVRAAATASGRAAATAVPGLPAERVGLVASVSACCAAYATVLGGAA